MNTKTEQPIPIVHRYQLWMSDPELETIPVGDPLPTLQRAIDAAREVEVLPPRGLYCTEFSPEGPNSNPFDPELEIDTYEWNGATLLSVNLGAETGYECVDESTPPPGWCQEAWDHMTAMADDPMSAGAPVGELFEAWEKTHEKKCETCRERRTLARMP